MSLQIRTAPDPILRQKSKRVKKIDSQTKKLIKEMINFLKPKGKKEVKRGIGLAAPQVGKLFRIIVVWSKGSQKFLPMINPKIVWKSKRTKLGLPDSPNPYEGCLSLPGIWGKVRRHSVIKVRYLNLKNHLVIRKFKGLTGVIIQHEIDHLEGILFTDRITQQGGEIIRQQ